MTPASEATCNCAQATLVVAIHDASRAQSTRSIDIDINHVTQVTRSRI